MLYCSETILNWLKENNMFSSDCKYFIRNTLNGTVIDVDGNVNIAEQNLNEIPINFGHVWGDFDCSGNNLQSLNGSPVFVSGDFMCQRNNLASLENGPEIVNGAYICYENKLTRLQGIAKVIKKYIECALNPIESIDDNLNITLGGFFHHCNSDNSTIKELESFYKIKNGQLHVQINSYELLEVINSINLKNTLDKNVKEKSFKVKIKI